MNRPFGLFLAISILGACSTDAEFSSPQKKHVNKRKVKATESNSPTRSNTPLKTSPGPENSTEPPNAGGPIPQDNFSPDAIDYRVDADSRSDDSKTHKITKTFLTSERLWAEAVFKSKSTNHQFDVPLRRNIEDHQETFNQVNRIPGSARFDQGLEATNVSDDFQADVSYGAIDIVVVIDNSGSMKEEQTNLSTKLSSLLTSIGHASWQIAIVTTDVAEKTSCHRTLIRKGDVNAQQLFEAAITGAGTSGAGNEKGLEMAIHAMSCSAWLQANSSIAVLIVSDEDNCSSGCASDSAGKPGSLKAYLESVRTADDTAVYGIIDVPGPSDGSTCSNYDPLSPAARVGLQYQDEIDATGGTSGSICASSYADTLENMSDGIATLIKDEYRLSQTPLAGTLAVTVNGSNYTNFSLNQDQLTLNGTIAENAAINASYTSRASTITSSFDLGRSDIASDGLQVLINGAEASVDTYARDGATLRFQTPPPEAATILVHYFLNQPQLSQEFPLTRELISGSLQVTVNGVPTQEVTFDPNRKTLEFTSPPADGATINVAYQAQGSPVLTYPIVEDFEPHDLLGIYRIGSPNPLDASFDQGRLTIRPEQFVDGDTIRIDTQTYTNQGSITLADSAIPESVEILDSACLVPPKISIDQNKASLTCEGKNSETRIRYQYERGIKNTFDIGHTPEATSTIEVTLNGQVLANSEYDISGPTLTMKVQLPPSGTIQLTEHKVGPAP